jgi:hypothetical protein
MMRSDFGDLDLAGWVCFLLLPFFTSSLLYLLSSARGSAVWSEVPNPRICAISQLPIMNQRIGLTKVCGHAVRVRVGVNTLVVTPHNTSKVNSISEMVWPYKRLLSLNRPRSSERLDI